MTIAALIAAETWLGASGWARGSQTCNGTRPAFNANPNASATNATSRAAAGGVAAAMSSKPMLPAPAASRARPASTARKLAWVSTAYQARAGRTEGRLAWSAATSTVEASAISSQPVRKTTTSPAAVTSSIPARNTAYAVQALREAAGPCGVAAAEPSAQRADRAHERHEQAGQPVRLEAQRDQPGVQHRRHVPPGEGKHPAGSAGQPQQRAGRSRRDAAGPGRGEHRGQHRDDGQGQLGKQPPGRAAHRRVSVRSAAVIWPGEGGQPGTATSTGTKSATVPATP